MPNLGSDKEVFQIGEWISKLWHIWKRQFYYFVLLYCTSQILHFFFFFFTNWRSVATLCWASQSVPFFSKSIYSLWVFVSHIFVILTFQTFSLLYLLWSPVISDLLTIIIALGCQELSWYKMANLINQCSMCVLYFIEV